MSCICIIVYWSAIIGFQACYPGTFGEDCEYTCDNCLHGSKCSESSKGCECKPGWMGTICELECEEVMTNLCSFTSRSAPQPIAFIRERTEKAATKSATVWMEGVVTTLPATVCVLLESKVGNVKTVARLVSTVWAATTDVRRRVRMATATGTTVSVSAHPVTLAPPATKSALPIRGDPTVRTS